jgi:hypothetical protein
MKKFIFSALALSMVMFSCQKKDISVKDNNNTIEQQTSDVIIETNTQFKGLEVTNDIVYFKTVKDYLSLMELNNEGVNKIDEFVNFMSTTSFESYAKVNDEKFYDDYFMNSIMNKDKIVKIDEWFILIDPKTEKVLTLSENDEENAYEMLVNQSSHNIKEFLVGDDVIDHLVSNTMPEDRSCGGIGSIHNSETRYIAPGVWYTGHVKFLRFGVYFTLFYGFDSNDFAGQYIPRVIEIKGTEGWWKRRPCNSNSVGTTYAGNHNMSSAVYKENRYVYQNVRNLNGVYLFARLKVNGVVFSYVGKNVNSPY